MQHETLPAAHRELMERAPVACLRWPATFALALPTLTGLRLNLTDVPANQSVPRDCCSERISKTLPRPLSALARTPHCNGSTHSSPLRWYGLPHAQPIPDECT